ncbi:MAG: redoxin family protein [Anaerolineae bacterium]|jgi:peroxiredoxin|nr:redoxin family protein [Anaerolineae bacterium]
MYRSIIGLLIGILTACGAANVEISPTPEIALLATATPPAEIATDIPPSPEVATEVIPPSPEVATEVIPPPVNTASALAPWQTIALTDARTGSPFTLGDFGGKTVFVEPMATWCTNCRSQLNNVREARAQLNRDDVVFIGISVETNLSAADLAQYADTHGFDWIFAVATPELLTELTLAFGRTITNPPSTPHFIIQPDGTVGPLITGIETVDQILQQVGGA